MTDRDDAGSTAAKPTSAGMRRSALAISLLLVALAESASILASSAIARYFPDRPTPRDLLFEVLPHVPASQYICDIALFSALAILLASTVRRRPGELPGVISIFSVMYLLRAAAMILTPLASAAGNGAHFGLLPFVQNGMWPSGHAAAALLCVLLVDPDSRSLKRLMLVLASVVWASLIVGHSHYSIDVVGGLLLAYFVAMEWRRGSLFDGLKRLTGSSAV